MASFLNLSTLELVQIFIGKYFMVLLGQSALDKMLHYKGNKTYIQSYFEKTILAKYSGTLFHAILLLEGLSAVLCLVGVLQLFFNQDTTILNWGLEFAVTSILCLFLGQRVAKDYAAAASISIYFFIGVFGLYILN